MVSSPVIVGVDGSSDSVRALQWAAEYARLVDAPLHALTVYQVPAVWGPYAMRGLPDADALADEAHRVLADTVRETLGEGAQVTQRVESGHTAYALVMASHEAQLVVVGSRGHGGFTGLLLGSVSQYCVTHARCPVIVMPHEDQWLK